LFLMRWHPRCASFVHALPLCGAALTFFAAAKKVSKESGLTPPILDRYPRALNVPTLHTATICSTLVASVLNERLTRFKRFDKGTAQRMARVLLGPTVCWSSRRTTRGSCQKNIPCLDMCGAITYTPFAAKGPRGFDTVLSCTGACSG